MPLSRELISEFVKITKDETPVAKEKTLYGTVVYDGRPYVQLDGSGLLTPVTTTTRVNHHDRVTVMIKDHTAIITGNMTAPSATTGDVDSIGNKVDQFDNVIADKVSTWQLEAQTGRIDELVSDNITVRDRLTAQEAKVVELVAENATITGKLTAQEADIKRVDAEVVNTKNLVADKVDADRVDALEGNFNSLSATHAEFQNTTIADLTAKDAEIANLKAKDATIEQLVAEKADVKDLHAQSAEIENLKAKDAEIENLYAKRAEVDDLYAKKAEIKNLDTKYANIDFTNIGDAAIDTFYAKSGIINKVTISEGVVVKELVGVTIKGDLIEGGTVKADKLVVKGSDGIYYKLNYEAGKIPTGEPVPDDSLHGSVITAKSITAEKVSVNDLVAFGATIGGFHITDNALYSGAKGAVDADAIRGVYLDAEGQFALGDTNNFLKYYKDPKDGKYKLEIAADQFKLSSGKTLEESVTDNLEIGARNLIRNSRTMIFEDYCFAGDSAVLGTAVIGAMILGKEG